ncbi:hypothetical protein K439DRAFT_1410915 [Ramaria rubella]|nr:hypothetical protein K439DRAFT_1410915 [Ramaria rubella]
MILVLFPDVLKRAQTELNRVIGGDRLPTFAHQESPRVPYVNALFWETLRHLTVTPLGRQQLHFLSFLS